MYKLSKAFDELEKQFQVTAADRKAIYPKKRTLEHAAKVKNDEPISWAECISGFYDAVDLEEKRKIAIKGMKPMSQAALKARNVKSVYVDNDGELKVNRFSKTKPINTKPLSSKKK